MKSYTSDISGKEIVNTANRVENYYLDQYDEVRQVNATYVKSKNRQYRTLKRTRQYTSRLVERSFCLDVNILSREGLFRGGRGPKWDYECRNRKEGFRGGVYLTLTDSPHFDEFYLRVEEPGWLVDGPVNVRVIYQSHQIGRWRHWFKCPRCLKRVAMLFIPLGAFELACRRCHRLVYWSQMRGRRRLGDEKYAEQKERYRVQKQLITC